MLVYYLLRVGGCAKRAHDGKCLRLRSAVIQMGWRDAIIRKQELRPLCSVAYRLVCARRGLHRPRAVVRATDIGPRDTWKKKLVGQVSRGPIFLNFSPSTLYE